MIAEQESLDHAETVLAIDVGNSITSVAAVNEQTVKDRVNIPTENLPGVRSAVVEGWKKLEGRTRQIICGSVVPEVSREIRALSKDELNHDLLAIREDIAFAIPLDVENPETVGVDRVCSATAAFAQLGQTCVVADFGTATKIDLISSKGAFLGGTIAPGIGLSARILNEATATLPLIEVKPARAVLGKNTASAMNNGIVLSAVGGLREIVERIATDLGHWPTLILTGGYADLVAGSCNFADHVLPDLCLRGIAWTYQANQRARQD